MNQQTVRGVSHFREFKTSNVIKVSLSNGEVLKGIYIGTQLYESRRMLNQVDTGQYMVIYDVRKKEAQVIDVIKYCQQKGVTIVSVGSSRLMKGLSDFLRGYYREFIKYQVLQKQAMELRSKTDDFQHKLDRMASQEIDESVVTKMQEEINKQDPIGMVKVKLTSEAIGFDVRYYMDKFQIEHYFHDVQVQGEDVGASTLLEYDDTRYVADEPKSGDVERLLHKRGYTTVSQSDFAKLANKYKSVAIIRGPYLTAYLRDGKGDRFVPLIQLLIEFKNPGKLTEKQVGILIADLKALHQKSTHTRHHRR